MRKSENKPNPFARLEAICRREGIPTTVQRRVIFAALVERNDHPTVDQVYDDVKERLPGISRTTVYRTLETFANLGLARRTNHFAASARYDGNMEQHHHLVCTACAKVIDYQDPNLTVATLPDLRGHGFTLFDYSVYFEGFCSDCKTPAAPPKSRKTRAPNLRPKRLRCKRIES